MGGPKEATWIDYQSPSIQYIEGPIDGISSNLADSMYDFDPRSILVGDYSVANDGVLTDKDGPYRLMVYQGTAKKVAK